METKWDGDLSLLNIDAVTTVSINYNVPRKFELVVWLKDEEGNETCSTIDCSKSSPVGLVLQSLRKSVVGEIIVENWR